MTTLAAPSLDAFDENQDLDVVLELSPAELLRGAILYADLVQIRRIVADFDFDLRDTSSRPAGLPYTVIKHLGPRKTTEQVNALAWFLSNGLYDDNYKLKAMVERMVAAGVDGDAHLVAGSLTGSIA